jgi:Tol biopolymer transport system component
METSTVITNISIGDNQRILTILKKREKNPLQLSLFDSDADSAWYQYAITEAQKLKSPFWFSDLRRLLRYGPRHENIWGQLAKKMKKVGYKQTGRYRPSETGSRRGGLEAQWERIGSSN